MSHRASVHTDPAYSQEAEGLSAAARSALEHESAPSGDVTIVLTDEDRIRELNRSFRGTDGTTDVLSFPDGQPDPDTGRIYYGDVILCVPVAKAQAERARHSLQAELALLTVHGVLHLLGHDHASTVERRRMWAAQDAILATLGAPDRRQGK